MDWKSIKRKLAIVGFIIFLILLMWASFAYEQNDYKEWQEENPGGSWWDYQMDWKWQNSW